MDYPQIILAPSSSDYLKAKAFFYTCCIHDSCYENVCLCYSEHTMAMALDTEETSVDDV